MLDGVYQSVICYFFAWLVFRTNVFVTENGRGVDDRDRMGVFVACVAVLVINSYILMNTYHWDWLMLLITTISILLVWAWTGIYTSFPQSYQFFKAGAEVYGTLTFWVETLLTAVVCLLPRFATKYVQKNFFPYDIDVVREQVRQGKFDYLNNYEAYVPPKVTDSSGTSSDHPEESVVESMGMTQQHNRFGSVAESQRPIYPPSEAPTQKTKHPHSQTGSDGTDRTKPSLEMNRMQSPRFSLERHRQPINESPRRVNKRPSLERVRSSFERSRQSFDRLRPSFEGSRDFTSAALLTRLESSHSNPGSPLSPTVSSSRRHDITSDLQ